MVLAPIAKTSASSVITSSALNARFAQFAITTRRSEPKMQFEQATRRLPWRMTRWPSSPVGLKKYAASSSPSSPLYLEPDEEGDNQNESPQFEPLSTPSNNVHWKRREIETVLVETPEKKCIDLEDQKSISLAKIRASVRSSSLSSVLSTTTNEVGMEVTLMKTSVYEELDEFRRHGEEKVKMFPDYLSEKERMLVKHVADSLRLGCQIGERTIAVFKTGPCEGHALLGRPNNRALAIDSGHGEDVYVDVPALAQHGKDGFISRLRLQRLSSGGGLCRNMLWDVAQLSSADGIVDPVSEGDGGVYAVQSKTSGEKLAMFKPVEEEKFVREGIYPGEGAVREEAAYVLDSRSNGFSGVPATAVARLHISNIGKAKHGAVQRFMGSTGSMESYGMPYDLVEAEKFVPVSQVHRVALLDIRTFNTDRHPGNILLIGDKAPYTMVPIDHGCILPSWFHLSEARFDWIEYPQCKVPFSESALSYIESLDENADALVLRKLGIREECVATMKICAMFLKLSARAGRTLHWMGTFMQREGCFENPSSLELAIQQACHATVMQYEFVANEYGEQKAQITASLLSRRPPSLFYKNLEKVLKQAV